MKDVSVIAKDTLPLFDDMSIRDVIELKNPKHLYPTRIKFVYDPNQRQIMYPGIYFVIPNNLSPKEIALLDRVLTTNLTDMLDVPNSLIDKFKRAGNPKKYHKAFNYFIVINDELHIKNDVVGFITDPYTVLTETDIDSPEYGHILSVDTIALLVQIAFMSICFSDNINDKTIPIIIKNSNKLSKLYPNASVIMDIKSDDIQLSSGDFKVSDFCGCYANSSKLDQLHTFVCSFHSLFLNVNKYMGW